MNNLELIYDVDRSINDEEEKRNFSIRMIEKKKLLSDKLVFIFNSKVFEHTRKKENLRLYPLLIDHENLRVLNNKSDKFTQTVYKEFDTLKYEYELQTSK